MLILVGAVLFIFATIGGNVITNIVSPAFDLANVFPRALNFKRGALLACVLALLVMPWRFYNSTVAINHGGRRLRDTCRRGNPRVRVRRSLPETAWRHRFSDPSAGAAVRRLTAGGRGVRSHL